MEGGRVKTAVHVQYKTKPHFLFNSHHKHITQANYIMLLVRVILSKNPKCVQM